MSGTDGESGLATVEGELSAEPVAEAGETADSTGEVVDSIEAATQIKETDQETRLLAEIDVAQRRDAIRKRDKEWEMVLEKQGIEKDGVTIYGSEGLSNPDAKVVLCLAGFTQTGEGVYGDIAKQLCEDPNVVVIMLSTPGSVGTTFTEKALNGDDYSAEDYAKFGEALLANLGIEKVDVVVGHSLGGAAASLMEVKNRVLLAPAFRITQKFEVAIRALQMTPPWLKSWTPPFLRKRMVSWLMGPTVPSEFSEQYAEQLFDKLDSRAIAKVFGSFTNDIRSSETQLATGNTVAFLPKKDRIVDSTYGAEVVANFSKVDMRHLEGGHNTHMNAEAGKEVVEVIREMLS